MSEIICPACYADIDDGGVSLTCFDVARPPPHKIYTTICRQCARRLDEAPWPTAKKVLERVRVTFRQADAPKKAAA